MKGTQPIGNSPHAEVFNVTQTQVLPVTADQLQTATRKDPVLGRVLRFTRYGWPDNVSEVLKPYWHRRLELSLEGECVMWGLRVIVPKQLQSAVLEELHVSHPGIVRMKELSRSHVWWPHLDRDLETLSKNCDACQEGSNVPAAAPLHPWSWPTKPWKRIHLDFAGPFLGRKFMIMVDAHSKWPEVLGMSSTTAEKTIEVLRLVFVTHGLPEQVVSDNGRPFNSDEFRRFMKSNGIKHLRSSPYHPSSNVLAERLVQTFKQTMKRGAHQGLTVQQRLADFLLRYRITPHLTTHRAPTELLMGRKLRTRLHLLHPDCSTKVRLEQALQKQHADKHRHGHVFLLGQRVFAQNYGPGPRWVAGVIVGVRGGVNYEVRVNDCVWRRH